MEGKVFSGLGRGAHFVRIYSDSIEEGMGFRPFPGTLNLRLEKAIEFRGKELRPEGLNPIVWRRVRINGTGRKAAAIRPVMTSHKKDVVEIISPEELRAELGLEDGDAVSFEFV